MILTRDKGIGGAARFQSAESCPELFIPIRNPRVVRANGSPEAGFCCDLEGKHATLHTVNKLGTPFERDNGVTDVFTV